MTSSRRGQIDSSRPGPADPASGPTVDPASRPTAPPLIWINGLPASPDNRHVAATDRGFTLADGVFETMRVHRGIVFRLEQHLARLRAALAALEIPEPAHVQDWVAAAVRDGGESEAAVRLTVTRGIGAGGLMPADGTRPTVVVTVTHAPVFPAAVYENGLAAHVASGRRNERAMTASLKTVAYTDAVAALLEARRAGADEALFLDTEDHCSEATASNLFVWTGDTLMTPPITCGALPGITRAVVLDLAQRTGVRTVERAFGIADLIAAREAFLTSSLRRIAPLVSVNQQVIGNGVPGAMTRRLSTAYAELVDDECRAAR